MKIQYKAASIMILFGIVIVTILSLGYDKLSHKTAIDSEKVHIERLSNEISQHVESHIKEKATIALTLSSAPIIKEALLKSNSDYEVLTDKERKHDIESINQQWNKAADVNNPFIQSHLTNPIAEFFKHHQVLFPGEYGEIFLTNRYGVMISSTGKLSTITHAHKYWWIAGYNDGKGRIFLDDRGFDSSVQGYVLGVVIPIIDKKQIIGMLKCNVNIIGPLSDVVQNFALRHSGQMKIVRTGGLVVSEGDTTPLSTQVDEAIVKLLHTNESGSTLITIEGESQFMAFTPVQITVGSEQIGFGGSQESIDHIKGNQGEAWHILISHNKNEALAITNQTTLTIVVIGMSFTLFTAIIALFLGKLAAKPIVTLSTAAQDIGKGRLETRVSVSSKDEIGALGQALNSMAQNLQDTMAYRDELIHEVDLRKKSEEELNKTTQELSERLKELNCLYQISEINDNENSFTEEKLQGIADIIPISWQYPEMTCAQITIGSQSYESEGFKETEWFQSQKFISTGGVPGEVKVVYSKKKPIIDEGPFLKEERHLLNTIAKRITNIVDKKEAKDATDKLESHLQQAQKMESIGNLAGGIAHDFNNILSAIIGFTELALEAAPKGSSQKEDLEEVYIAGNRAKELVQQILAFARQSEKQTKPIKLSDIVTETLKLLRPSTPTTIDIKPTINSGSKIMGNNSQLHQIVMNLCTNATQSLQKSGGILEIALKNIHLEKDSEPKSSRLPSGEYVELTVSDNGPGIAPTIIENIFEPYFTTKGVGKGSGMGLAVVKGIVESYGGDIEVHSELGVKTSFTIRFPVATGKNSQKPDKVAAHSLGTERILFVDDEPPIARMGSRILESLGYTVTIRTSSFEALELFKKKPDAFDLLITDMTMPSMTGDMLSTEVRKVRHDIPIIICTGYSNQINEARAQKIGIEAFVYKPLAKADLAKTVRDVLDLVRD